MKKVELTIRTLFTTILFLYGIIFIFAGAYAFDGNMGDALLGLFLIAIGFVSFLYGRDRIEKKITFKNNITTYIFVAFLIASATSVFFNIDHPVTVLINAGIVIGSTISHFAMVFVKRNTFIPAITIPLLTAFTYLIHLYWLLILSKITATIIKKINPKA